MGGARTCRRTRLFTSKMPRSDAPFSVVRRGRDGLCSGRSIYHEAYGMFDFRYQTVGKDQDILAVVLTGSLNEGNANFLLDCVQDKVLDGSKKLILDCSQL